MVDVHNVIDYVRAPGDSCLTIRIIFFVWLELMDCVLLLFESLLGCQGRWAYGFYLNPVNVGRFWGTLADGSLSLVSVVVSLNGFEIDVVALAGDWGACTLVKVGGIGWGPHAGFIPEIGKLRGLIWKLV